jgi:hypothetical protein
MIGAADIFIGWKVSGLGLVGIRKWFEAADLSDVTKRFGLKKGSR